MLSAPRTALVLFALQSTAVSQICTEQVHIEPPDLQRWERLGWSVAVGGERVYSGRWGEPDPVSGLPGGDRAGVVRVHDRITGQPLGLLRANDAMPDDGFGFSVAASASHVVVGAILGQGVSSFSGAAYVFDGPSGQQLHKLQPDGGSALELFGVSVALDGSQAIVGSPFNWSTSTFPGAAYVFDLSTGQQTLRLGSPAPGGVADFGSPVAIGGGLAVVGSNGNDRVYVFDSNTGQWLHTLTSPSPANPAFGGSVAIQGSRVLVGEAGAVRVFDGATGQLLTSLSPPNGPDPWFGGWIAVDGGHVAVGHALTDTAGYDAGSVHVFDLASGLRIAQLVPSSPTEYFPTTLAYGGGTVVVGAPFDSSVVGAGGSVFVFDDAPTNSGAGSCYADGLSAACPCAQSSPSSGCPNSVDLGPDHLTSGAILFGAGDAVLGGDSLVLHVSNAPGGAAGLFVQGGSQAPLPVGEGVLCVGESLRYPVQVASAGGTTSLAGLGSQASAGTTVSYQFWYRDTANTCAGAGFNLTNAWNVSW